MKYNSDREYQILFYGLALGFLFLFGFFSGLQFQRKEYFFSLITAACGCSVAYLPYCEARRLGQSDD